MIRCFFCRTAVTGVEEAVHFDWIPSFYDGDREVAEPVCPACFSARLQIADDGEFEPAVHNRYADEAEAVQRDKAWLHAAALWQTAADKCRDAQRREYYERQATWCRDMAQIGS